MKIDTVRVFAISKLDWIRSQKVKICEQERETLREYLDRESHYVWGTRYLLQVVEHHASPRVELKPSKMILRVRPRAAEEKKRVVVAQFYREQINAAAPALIEKWEPIMGVKVARFYVRQMKTKWGSCNPRARSIRLNTELAKKPRHLLEYIVVHEMAHLLLRRHDDRFANLMDRLLPSWRLNRDQLNRLPLGHC